MRAVPQVLNAFFFQTIELIEPVVRFSGERDDASKYRDRLHSWAVRSQKSLAATRNASKADPEIGISIGVKDRGFGLDSFDSWRSSCRWST